MRKFRFVGSIADAKGYEHNGKEIPEIGKVYDENEVFCDETVLNWSNDHFLDIYKEWEEVFEQEFKEKE